MRQIALVLLSIVLLLPSAPGYAQTREDGCIAEIRSAITATTDVLDYDAACTQFQMCVQSEMQETDDFDRYTLNLCQMVTFEEMLAQCPVDDTRCTDGAVLFAAALLVIEDRPRDTLPPPHVLEGIPAALDAYWQGDDETALAIYADLPQYYSDVPYHNASIPLSIAVLQRRLGQPEVAFEQYTDAYDYAFDILSELPLGWYTRSLLYGEQGRDIEAGIEAAVLRYYFADDIDRLPSVVALQAQYPFDDSRLEDWLYYPVSINYDGSPLGDLTLRDPLPIQVALFPEVNQIVTLGLYNELWREPGQRPPLWQFWTADGTHYAHEFANYGYIYHENPGGIYLRVEGDALWGQDLEYYQSESMLDDRFVLAPADAPDPREIFSETRYCEDGASSHVMVGMTVRLLMYWNPPLDSVNGEGVLVEGAPYVDSPGGELAGLVSPDSRIHIIGGYECVGRVIWWQFETDDGVSGWMPENSGTTYILVPVIEQ